MLLRALMPVCFVSLISLSAISQSVTVSPTSLSFGNQVQGTASAVKKVTLKNGQGTAVTVTSITSSLSDYTQTNTCPVSPSTLGPGKSCTISVTFDPAALGSRPATLTIVDTGKSSPQTVSLSGTGVAAVTVSTSSISFGNQAIGVKSAASKVTVTNNQNTALTINKISTTLADYTTTTTCPVGTKTVPAKSSCSISVFFDPTVAGARNDTLTVSDNASVSPTVSLSGTGVVAAVVNPASLTFGNQALGTSSLAQTVTFTNNQSTALTITSISSNLIDFSVTSTCPLSPSTLAAGGSCTASVTFAPTALNTRTGTLTFSDNASNSPTVALTGTGIAANLVSIAVTPANPSIAKGTNQQFVATGTYSDGSTQNLTGTATWSSSATNVLSVTSAGLATGAGIGTATITATSGSVTGSTAVTVTSAALVSITVTPAIPSIAAGTTQQFTATGTYSDATTQDITGTVQWASSAAGVATISNVAGTVGLATSVGPGSTTISATSGSVTGSTILTVTSVMLASIAVTPSAPSIALGTKQQFSATGTFTDGSTQNITGSVQWSSDSPNVATIGSTTGLATSVAQGNATITATSGSISGSANLTVTAAVLISIAVNPSAATVALGTTQQFTATGTFSDGTTQDVTLSGSWTSSAPNVATISDTAGSIGLATSLGTGTTTITISSGSVSGSASLTVTPAALISISISPQSPSIALGKTQQFSATGTYTDGSTQDVTSIVTWSTANAAIAVISNSSGSQGLATSSGQGTVTISATSGSISSSTQLTVTGAALVSIAITPQTPAVSLGATQQFTATGTYSDDTTQDITTTVAWVSTNTSVATISNSIGSFGLASTLGLGSTTITATSNSITSSATLIVVASGPTLVSISVSPGTATISPGSKQQFTATGNYSDGSTQNLTASATWSSSATSIATVSNSAGTQGLASAVAAGSASITATFSGLTGSATLTISAATLTSISVSPLSPTIAVTAKQQFTATGTYSDNGTQDITTSVTWSSGTQSVATISNSSGSQGLATGVGVGTSTITASQGSLSASSQLTVTPLAGPPVWTLSGPHGRRSHSAIFDPNSQQMIVFGGLQTSTNTTLNDVWLGNISAVPNETFIAESPSGTLPAARFGHVAAYDSTNNRMMVFGGNTGTSTCMNDFWILSGANGQSGVPSWMNETTSGTAPSPRVNSGGAYDPNTNSMIVFGGNDCFTNYFNDVWVLSNANGLAGTSAWTQLSPSGTAPLARQNGTAIYDSANNVLIVYGGDAGGSPFGDVWILSHANGTGGTPAWTQLLPTGTAPAARTGHSATFDSANDRMTIFGGTTGSSTFADAWVLTNANGIGATPSWIQIVTAGTAPSVAYHSAVYDAAKNNLYAFAGISTQDKLQANDHAFTLSGANGLSSGPKWTLAGPPVRYSQSAFYDPSTNGVFIFGGQHATTNIDFNDYWEQASVIGSLTLQWISTSTKGTKPSSRFGHTGLYDSGSNRMMVFGGATGFPSPCANDYFILQQANTQGGSPTWLSVTPTGTAPPVRTRHSSAYDSATNTLIIFGGYDCQSTYRNDVWILQNANDMTGQPNWVQLLPTGGPPSVRESSSAIYDPTTNSLVVYGGDAGSTPLGDIWILSNANGTGGTPAWTQLNPSNSGPVARSGHTATYDSKTNVMTVYGGYDGKNVLSDTWVLSGANGQAGSATWTQVASGQPRRFASSMYDPVSNEMITFGGAAGITPQAPSAESYTLSDANDGP